MTVPQAVEGKGPRRAVIAAFGSTRGASSESLEAARRVGAAVIRGGALLLTGGERCGPTTVKGAAICGAEEAISEGAPGAWIGVPQGGAAPGVAVSQGVPHLVLITAMDDERNYLEACLADAAVALPGGTGTDSEIAFCLALGRPVVLVGAGWGTKYPVRADAFAHFVDGARNRVMSRGRVEPVLGRAITRAFSTLSDQATPFRARRDLPESHDDADDVVDEVMELLGEARPGQYPSLPGHDEVASRYRAFLEVAAAPPA